MKCVIPGANIKVLAKAIHALAKIGDEIYLQPLQDALSLRTVNMVNSAYSDFTFNEHFFSYYNYGNISSQDALECKISVRSAMTVFKTPNVLEKQVETCHIKLTPKASKLILVLKYRSSIVKTHMLPIIDCDILKATYDKENVPNKISIQPKVLTDVVQNFPQNLLEITLDVNEQKTLIRNYIDDKSNITYETRTQFVLGTGEFDNYVIGKNTTITFCLKELKALLHFAEGVNLIVHIHFETTGRPVVIFLRSSLFEVNLVQSTLNVDTDSQSEISMPMINRNMQMINNSKKRQLKRTNNTKSSINKRPKKTSTSSSKTINETVSRLLHDIRSEPQTPKCNSNSRLRAGNSSIPDIASINSSPKTERTEATNFSTQETDNQDVQQNPEEDFIPASPKRRTSKKAKMIFQKCFQTTFHPAMLPGHDTILAEDSDEENQ